MTARITLGARAAALPTMITETAEVIREATDKPMARCR